MSVYLFLFSGADSVCQADFTWSFPRIECQGSLNFCLSVFKCFCLSVCMSVCISPIGNTGATLGLFHLLNAKVSEISIFLTVIKAAVHGKCKQLECLHLQAFE